ncbi:MAG: HDOD domain-containing protein [Deltaproteobacteria bacterium]
MENKAIWDTLEKITDLPTLPSVYFKVDKLLKDKQASIENVARIIEIDPAMSSSILRLVNSAFYGLSAKSNSIAQAVMILGFNAVKNAIVSVAILDTLSIRDRYRNFNIADFWRHSVSVAVLGRHLAERSRLTAPDDAFMAGLLHDIGKIIMIRHFNDDFGRVWQTMQETKCSFADAEAEAASIDHVTIGAYLARKWQLPEHIIFAIAGHHYYITSGQSTGLVECVMLANALSNNGYQINPDDYVFEEPIEKALKTQLSRRDSWLPQAAVEIDAACAFFLSGK